MLSESSTNKDRAFDYLTRNGYAIERAHAGKHIAIEGEVIIAAEKSADKLAKRLGKLGVSDPLVTFIDPAPHRYNRR